MTTFVTGGSGFLGGELIRTLVAGGESVAALARSEAAAKTVSELGASPIAGDIHDRSALSAGMAGADLVYHCAARLGQYGPIREFIHDNVDGTQSVLDSARAVGVRRFVHVSTEAVLADGKPIVDADESAPRPRDVCRPYGLTKGMAEDRVLAANGEGLETVIVRPRFIWGEGDTTLLPELVNACRSGRFAWFGDGRYLTSTCHVSNVVAGMLAAAARGTPGAIYFLTDGPPVEFRSFISEMVATQGVTAPDRTIPLALARLAAAALESAWTLLQRADEPPLTRTTIALGAQQVTVSDRRAREELGYEPPVTREAGLAGLRAGGGGSAAQASP
jgi:nucleoside-diphosphate-sugar epimerase